jgi:hypothetical protein
VEREAGSFVETDGVLRPNLDDAAMAARQAPEASAAAAEPAAPTENSTNNLEVNHAEE